MRSDAVAALLGLVAAGCMHGSSPMTALAPAPSPPAGADGLPFFADLAESPDARLVALDAAGDRDGRFTRSDAVHAGAHPPVPLVDLHVHPVMHRALTPFFDGGLDAERVAEDPDTIWRTQVNLPALRRSGVNVILAAAYVPFHAAVGRGNLGEALHQLRELRAVAAAHPGVLAVVRSAAEARAVARAGGVALLPALEGGHSVGRVEDVDVLFRAGVRMLTITHFADGPIAGAAASNWAHPENFNFFGSSTEQDGVALSANGVTPFGRAVLRRMVELGMVIDLAHASDATIRDALAEVSVPFVVSHTAARALHGAERNLSDPLARAIAERGGVIGVSTWRVQLAVDGVPECRSFAAHFRHLLGLVGQDHIGLGSDFNGLATRSRACAGGGSGVRGTGLRNIGDVPALLQQLVDEGVPPAMIDRLGENSLRVFEAAERAADPLAVERALATPDPAVERWPGP